MISFPMIRFTKFHLVEIGISVLACRSHQPHVFMAAEFPSHTSTQLYSFNKRFSFSVRIHLAYAMVQLNNKSRVRALLGITLVCDITS